MSGRPEGGGRELDAICSVLNPFPVFGQAECRRPADPRITAGIVALAAIALLIGGAFAGLIVEGVRDLSGACAAFDPYLLPRRPLHAVAGVAFDAAVGRAGTVRRAGAVAASAFLRPRLHPAALRRAVGAAGHRRGARHARALRPCRLFRRRARLDWRPGLAGHLWPVGHPRRPCVLQSAAQRAAVPRGAADSAGRPVAAGEPARHGRQAGLPADRVADAARCAARRRRTGLHALHHLVHHRADAGRRTGARRRWRSPSTRRCASISIRRGRSH